jgi:hypothetical protein
MKKEQSSQNKPGRPIGSSRKKLNNIEVEDLLKKALDEILQKHLSYTQFTSWLLEEYGLSQQQSNEYWLRTWTTLNEKFRMEKDQMINKHLAHYWHLYDASFTKQDFSNARQVLNDISKLLGMNEPDKLDIKQELKIKFKFGGADEV